MNCKNIKSKGVLVTGDSLTLQHFYELSVFLSKSQICLFLNPLLYVPTHPLPYLCVQKDASLGLIFYFKDSQAQLTTPSISTFLAINIKSVMLIDFMVKLKRCNTSPTRVSKHFQVVDKCVPPQISLRVKLHENAIRYVP